jgi:hypothetical protein
MCLTALANALAHRRPAAASALDPSLTSALAQAAINLLAPDGGAGGEDPSRAAARVAASAALYNLTLHTRTCWDEERSVTIMCALCERIGAETDGQPPADEVTIRVLRAVGQLLADGGEVMVGVALSLGLGAHTAELAAAEPELHADLRLLLSEG